MREFLKGNLAVVLLVAAVAFGMWQWHRAQILESANDQMWQYQRANTKIDQTQNILSQLEFRDQVVAEAFRQIGYKIAQPKPVKQDTSVVAKRRGGQ